MKKVMIFTTETKSKFLKMGFEEIREYLKGPIETVAINNENGLFLIVNENGRYECEPKWALLKDGRTIVIYGDIVVAKIKKGEIVDIGKNDFKNSEIILHQIAS